MTASRIEKYWLPIGLAVFGGVVGPIVVWEYQQSKAARASIDEVPLYWSPADCDPAAPPKVAVGACSSQQDLGWLKQQLTTFRESGVEGFGALPEDVGFTTESFHGKANWLLFVQGVQGGTRYSLAVGYSDETKSKDGCLHLSSDGVTRSPPVCLDKSGKWWVAAKDGYHEAIVR